MYEADPEKILLLKELKKLEEVYKKYDELFGPEPSNPDNEIGCVICSFVEEQRVEVRIYVNNLMMKCIFKIFRVMNKIAAIDQKCLRN